jgi:GntR family transcriptional regulator
MTEHDPAEAEATAIEKRPTLEDEKGAWPQHELLANYLRDGILNGDYPPSSNLPSTRVLKEQFGVAPQTIKNANDVLAEEGLVTSRRGKGIVVRPHRQRTMIPAAYKEPAESGAAYSWINEAEKQGLQAASALIEVGEVKPPADVRDALGLDEEGLAVLRAQLLSLDGEPAELVKSYYPIELARGTALAVKRKIKGGSPRLLADMGYPPVRCVDRVASRLPTPEQAKALGAPTKLPILRTFRVAYSTDGRIIEVTVMAKAGHLYELQYEF